MALPFNVTGDVIEASQTGSVRAMAAVPAPSTHHELSEPSSLTKTVVPGIVVSPYAKRGYVDHQTLSFDAYDEFIEDDFLGGQRLNPTRPTADRTRPTVRENVRILGKLVKDFNFNQSFRPPMVLAVHPQTTLTG